jgi:hypothetical protein
MSATKSSEAGVGTEQRGVPIANYQTGQSDETEESPPSYCDVQPTEPTSEFLRPVSALASVDLVNYAIPESTISKDKTTVTTTFPAYASDPRALVDLLKAQVALPPIALVHIRGTHPEHGGFGTATVDFDLRLSIMPLLVRPETDRWQYLTVSELGNNDGTRLSGVMEAEEQSRLEGWAQRFCASPATNKSFIIERSVANWDTDYIEGQIRSLIASVRYTATLEISFPSTFTRVVVRPAAPSSSKWLGWLPKLEAANNFPSKPVQAIWPYANKPPGKTARTCASQTEQEWWQVWKAPIRNAILNKRQGWVAVEDWVESSMGVNASQPWKDWGPREWG